jgi:Asp-tRNA(Asn)/Glu-tRNA(Gln) amidotransferase B subunit
MGMNTGRLARLVEDANNHDEHDEQINELFGWLKKKMTIQMEPEVQKKYDEIIADLKNQIGGVEMMPAGMKSGANMAQSMIEDAFKAVKELGLPEKDSKQIIKNLKDIIKKHSTSKYTKQALSKVKEEVETKSELTQLVEETNKQLVENADPTIQKVAEVIKSNPKAGLMGLRSHFEKIFKKKDIDFTMMGGAHFRIKHKGKTIIVVNKSNVDDADMIVGELAIGYL